MLAQKYCARCHATGPQGGSPRWGATPFREFPLKWRGEELNRNVFKRMVMGAHPRVPDSVGDPNEFAKIIAYIKTLQPESGKHATPPE